MQYSPYAVHPAYAGDAELACLLLEDVFGVVIRDLAGFAHQSRVLELVAGDLLVQRLEAMQETPVGKSTQKNRNILFIVYSE